MERANSGAINGGVCLLKAFDLRFMMYYLCINSIQVAFGFPLTCSLDKVTRYLLEPGFTRYLVTWLIIIAVKELCQITAGILSLTWFKSGGPANASHVCIYSQGAGNSDY